MTPLTGVHVCPRCGSDRVHRSRTRSLVERLVAALSPLRVTRCHACGLRRWAARAAPAPGAADQRELGFPTRPRESRDEHAKRRRLKRIVVTVATAAAFGAVAALLLT